MITFIPLNLYHSTYYWLTLSFVALFCALLMLRRSNVVLGTELGSGRPHAVLGVVGFLYLFSILLMLGLRPISPMFADMQSYYLHFLDYKWRDELKDGDLLFEAFMYFSAHYLNAETFFFCCTFLSIVPLFIACYRVFKFYWPLAFFFTISNFDFYGYVINGIRQGIATSIFLMALTFKGKWSVLWMLVAAGFHNTILLPLSAYLLTRVYMNPKIYLYVWIFCLFLGGVYSGFGSLVSGLGFFSEDFDRYLYASDAVRSQFSSLDFRIDFVAYSLFPIVIGSYFILKRKMTDDFYSGLFCIYLTCNAFWLLVIRMPAANRIAYLSWFLTGFLVVYPLVKYSVFENQHKYFALTLFLFYLFTFFMR